MGKISNNDIHITRHPVDGFTLSYISDSNRYFKQRYIGYTVREAKKRFINYVHNLGGLPCKKA
jgi:hypothetical protein